MPCSALLHHAPASGWWISAAAAARPRWSLRAPSVRPAAWWDSTFPGRCWLRVRGAPVPPASPMSIGDRVAAFTNMRRAATPDARMAIVCWCTLAENPWMEVPMAAVAQHLPPRPKPVPNAPGMFAFADPEHVTEVLTAAGWAPPRFEKLDMDLDIAAGRGLEEAVVQSTEIGAVNSWLRNQPAQVISTAVASLREALAPYADGVSVRRRGAIWLISSAPA